MPTKPEQGDLEHVLYTSQGDSNRVVFAPADPAEAYDHARKAFQIAYSYQIPTIILYDQKLSGEYRNVPASHFDREPNPDIGATLTEDEIADAPHESGGKLHRFRHDPENGVSPRSVPGQKGGRFLASGNEHNEAGHISEDPDNRVAQVDRRNRKLESIREGLNEDGLNKTYGPEDAQYGILAFGSMVGTVEEAVEELNAGGESVKALAVGELAPYPKTEVREFIESVDSVMVVEMNSTAQFRGLTQKELGEYGSKLSSLLKYNGNPFEPAEIVEGFQNTVNGDGETAHQTTFVPAAGD